MAIAGAVCMSSSRTVCASATSVDVRSGSSTRAAARLTAVFASHSAPSCCLATASASRRTDFAFCSRRPSLPNPDSLRTRPSSAPTRTFLRQPLGELFRRLHQSQRFRVSGCGQGLAGPRESFRQGQSRCNLIVDPSEQIELDDRVAQQSLGFGTVTSINRVERGLQRGMAGLPDRVDVRATYPPQAQKETPRVFIGDSGPWRRVLVRGGDAHDDAT